MLLRALLALSQSHSSRNGKMEKFMPKCPNPRIICESPPFLKTLSEVVLWVQAFGLPRANQNRGCSEILFHTSISEKISTTPPRDTFSTLVTKRIHTHTHTQIYVRCNRSSLPTAFSRRARSASSDLQTP